MTAEKVEHAEYDVIEELGDRVEIRQYGELTLISTVSNDSDSGFRVLAGYIFGKNRQKTTISMTAPVIILPKHGSIDMSFVLPQGYDIHSAPEPDRSDILIHEMPPRKVATITFSGYAKGPVFKKNRAKLDKKLNEKGIKTKGEFFLMMYDPPWTPPEIKRNEVAIEVE
ncbi:MAG: heme-binding protein [Methanosarcinaceae archaeon]|nr:heme-binding protein [Methanosarcinaceae archaeon]